MANNKSIIMHPDDERYLEWLMDILIRRMALIRVKLLPQHLESVSFWLRRDGSFIGTSITLCKPYNPRFIWIPMVESVGEAEDELKVEFKLRELLKLITPHQGYVKTYILDNVGFGSQHRSVWLTTLDSQFDNRYLHEDPNKPKVKRREIPVAKPEEPEEPKKKKSKKASNKEKGEIKIRKRSIDAEPQATPRQLKVEVKRRALPGNNEE